MWFRFTLSIASGHRRWIITGMPPQPSSPQSEFPKADFFYPYTCNSFNEKRIFLFSVKKETIKGYNPKYKEMSAYPKNHQVLGDSIDLFWKASMFTFLHWCLQWFFFLFRKKEMFRSIITLHKRYPRHAILHSKEEYQFGKTSFLKNGRSDYYPFCLLTIPKKVVYCSFIIQWAKQPWE